MKIANKDNNHVIANVTETQLEVLNSKGYIYSTKGSGKCEYAIKEESYKINVEAYSLTNDEGYLENNSKE